MSDTGICGDIRTGIFGSHLLCTLKAGHAGWHQNDDTAQWNDDPRADQGSQTGGEDERLILQAVMEQYSPTRHGDYASYLGGASKALLVAREFRRELAEARQEIERLRAYIDTQPYRDQLDDLERELAQEREAHRQTRERVEVICDDRSIHEDFCVLASPAVVAVPEDCDCLISKFRAALNPAPGTQGGKQ